MWSILNDQFTQSGVCHFLALNILVHMVCVCCLMTDKVCHHPPSLPHFFEMGFSLYVSVLEDASLRMLIHVARFQGWFVSVTDNVSWAKGRRSAFNMTTVCKAKKLICSNMTLIVCEGEYM